MEQKLKILLVGDSSVGKSSLLLRYADDKFDPSFITTVGIDFKIKTILCRGKPLKVQIWDTAGQERFRTITNSYFRGAKGILLVYDVTEGKTFRNIRNWIRNIKQFAPNDVKLLLIGNKSDDDVRRVVDFEVGQSLADEYGIPFLETSAKKNINVENAFLSLIFDVVEYPSKNEIGQMTNNNNDNDNVHRTVDIHKVNPPNVSFCCN